MHTIYFDAVVDDDRRRSRLYDGDLFVYSPSPNTVALCQLARELAEDFFAPLHPIEAQYSLPVEKYAALLSEFKPKFIHHPEAKRCLQGILRDFGCDLEKTYFDVPRIRTSTAGGYLTSGIAYAFHPHRDTWYSAPMSQLNWWIPVYEIESENSLAFHARYWSEQVPNSSREYNYDAWVNTSRVSAAQHVKKDTRKQPMPEIEIDLNPQTRIITTVGGVIIFSAAQLHSSVPNTSNRTRISIDFRTVHLEDLAARRGAPNLDSECTGTTMRDYLRGTDLAHVPDEIIALYQ
jgi:hypothetical protein